MPAVPEELMARLHQANQQLEHARQRTDGLDQMDTAQKREMAAALRAAETEVEEATRLIDAFLASGNES